MASWARAVLAIVDDLEQQAAGLALVERDLEVADRSRAEFARVTLAARAHAAAGRRVRVVLLGGLALDGVLDRTGRDWVLLTDAGGLAWLVPHGAIAVLRGLSARAVADVAVGVVRRLPLRSVLGRLAADGAEAVVHLRDGAQVRGRLLRVGADFVELRLAGDAGPEGYDAVPLTAVAAVRSGEGAGR